MARSTSGKGSEPYMVMALPVSGGGVTAADVNLKFILDVVSQIKVGAGRDRRSRWMPRER